jgi:ankyrin repeat protein
MAAAVFGSIDIVREILKDFPNLEHRDKTGRTAHDWAQLAGRDELVPLLRRPE